MSEDSSACMNLPLNIEELLINGQSGNEWYYDCLEPEAEFILLEEQSSDHPLNSNQHEERSIDVKDSQENIVSRPSCASKIKHISKGNGSKQRQNKSTNDKNYLNQDDSHSSKTTCKICNVTFASQSNLITHMRIHSNRRDFKCNFCGRTFVQQSNLKSHIRLHTGERPYSCDICFKTFNRSNHLKSHRLTHENERPFSCSICEKKFISSTQLKQHLMKHNNVLTCFICGKDFSTVQSHLVHLQLHAGDRPFHCKECPATFRSTVDLRFHSKLHLPLSEDNTNLDFIDESIEENITLDLISNYDDNDKSLMVMEIDDLDF